MALTFAFQGQLQAAQLAASVNIGNAFTQDDTNSSGFSIETLRAAVDQYGLMKTNLHSVFFTPPRILSGFDTREVIIFCESSKMPGVGFASVEGHQRYGYGQVEKVPFLPIFNDLPLGFIVDAKGIIQEFFAYWMNSIVNFNVQYGLNAIAQTGAAPYEVTYKKDYITDIDIFVHNEGMEEIVRYTLRDAFPIAMSDIDLDWANQNQLAKLNVVFSFKDWHTQAFPTAALSNFGPFAFSLGGLTGNAPFNLPSSVANILNSINGQIVASF